MSVMCYMMSTITSRQPSTVGAEHHRAWSACIHVTGYFVSASVATVFSQSTTSSSALWNLPQKSTVKFCDWAYVDIVCLIPHLQTSDVVRPHLGRLGGHKTWPVRKWFNSDHEWRWNPGCWMVGYHSNYWLQKSTNSLLPTVGVCSCQKMTSVLQKTAVFGSVLQNWLRFQFFRFGFCTVCCLVCMHSTECFAVYCFITVLYDSRLYGTMLEMTHFRAELVQLTVNWSDSELEVQRYGIKKKYFDCWSYHYGRWIVNETTWKTIPRLLKSVFQNQTAETEFSGFWILRSVRFGF